jgi:hypothetical protein
MEWLQVLSLFLANAGLFLWFRSESRSDWRHMDQQMREFRETWAQEVKDFHARLCSIEERRLK